MKEGMHAVLAKDRLREFAMDVFRFWAFLTFDLVWLTFLSLVITCLLIY
jgi:hypothetical protein